MPACKETLVFRNAARHFRWALLLLALLGFQGVAQQAGDEWLVAYCASCTSEYQFETKALHTAPDQAPEFGTITYPVYVVNRHTSQIRFYNVLVWYDWGDMDPHGAGDGGSRGTRSGMSTQHNPLYKEAISAPGDVEILAAIDDAMTMVADIVASLESVDSGDVTNAPGSAIDLIGPGSELVRENFRLGIQDHLTSQIFGYQGQTLDLIERLIDNYWGESTTIDSRIVKIEFPDGTEIRVRIDAASINDPYVIVEVLTDEGRLPNGQIIPHSESMLNGFQFEGSPGVGNSLLDLLDRYGQSVNDPGGSMNCSWVCPDDFLCILSCSLN